MGHSLGNLVQCLKQNFGILKVGTESWFFQPSCKNLVWTSTSFHRVVQIQIAEENGTFEVCVYYLEFHWYAFTKGSPLVKYIRYHNIYALWVSNVREIKLYKPCEIQESLINQVWIAPREKTPKHDRRKIPMRIQKTWSQNLKTKTNC